MYDDDNWNSIAADEAETIFKTISPVDGKYATSDATTKAQQRTLPFYEHTKLVRVTDPSWGDANLALYYLLDGNELYRLDGQSNPIHEFNANTPPSLTDENVLDYLRFFAFFVRGEEGVFLIVENLENPELPQDMDDWTRKPLEKYLRPAEIEGKTEQGAFLCKAPVLYSNALFISSFEVHPSGAVDILEHETAAADLPFTASVPIS